MRGTARAFRLELSSQRIIPAHAGNSPCVEKCQIHVKDHPRTCGEQSTAPVAAIELYGSSPHMRGTVHCTSSSHRTLRIIPAHAGNSVDGVRPGADGADHPRTCGEQGIDQNGYILCIGSSPHMRGTVFSGIYWQPFRGIIPAHAGNSFICLWIFMADKDHPRTCGEQVVAICVR